MLIIKKPRRLPGANSKCNSELTLDLKEKSFNSYNIHFKIYLFLQIKNVIMCGNHYHRLSQKKLSLFIKKQKRYFIYRYFTIAIYYQLERAMFNNMNKKQMKTQFELRNIY